MSHIFSCQVSVISIKFWTGCDTVLSDILIYIYYISLSAQKVSRQMTLSHGIRSSELLACTLTDDKKEFDIVVDKSEHKPTSYIVVGPTSPYN